MLRSQQESIEKFQGNDPAKIMAPNMYEKLTVKWCPHEAEMKPPGQIIWDFVKQEKLLSFILTSWEAVLGFSVKQW